MADGDQAAHNWYRFVLSYPPHLVRTYLEEFASSGSEVVLDPFCGTGTTLVESKKHDLSSVGIEANFMAAFASRTKTDWSVDPERLLSEARKIAHRAASAFDEVKLEEHAAEAKQTAERRSLFGLRSLDEEQEKLILKGSISTVPLHRCLTLKECIDESPAEIRNHLLLALAWTIVNVAGNIRFGPEVGVTKPKSDAPVVESWLLQANRMAEDIRQLKEHTARTQVISDDSRRAAALLEPNSISAVITSPPYPNEKDYTRTTRLESVLLEFIKSSEELRSLKKGLLRSNTRNVYVGDADHLHVEENQEIQRIAEEIERRRIELGKDSGFERLYHKVTRLYFGGMAQHFAELRHSLRPGAMLAYVVGDQASYLRVMIRTGNLLSGIAKELGYEHVRTDLFRTRLATATKEQLREEVVILRWPG